MAVLISLGSVAYNSAQASARDTKRKTDLDTLKKALYGNMSDYGKFLPRNWTQTSADVSVADSTYWGATGLLGGYYISNNYLKSIPRDPKYSTSSDDYFTSIQNDTFTLSAKLEKPPSSNIGCTPASGRNYCISE